MMMETLLFHALSYDLLYDSFKRRVLCMRLLNFALRQLYQSAQGPENSA